MRLVMYCAGAFETSSLSMLRFGTLFIGRKNWFLCSFIDDFIKLTPDDAPGISCFFITEDGNFFCMETPENDVV